MQSTHTSEAIDLVRFPLAVMVVFIHSVVYPEETFFMPTDYTHLSGMDLYNLIRSLGSHVFSAIAVPTFFLISGYLFFKRLEIWNWHIWRKKIQNRFHTLAVPYFIWCVLSVLWRPDVWESYIRIPICKIGAVIFKGKPLRDVADYFHSMEPLNIDWLHELWDIHKWGGLHLNWLGGHVAYSTAPELLPFWFVRDLIVLVLLTPFVYWLVKKFGFLFVGLIMLFYVSGVWPNIHGLGSTSFFYFSLGACFTIKGYDFFTTMYPFRWCFYIPFIFLLPLMVYLDGEQTYGGRMVYVLMGVIAILCFSFYLTKDLGVRKNPLLVRSCFFVFAFHIFINRYVYRYVNLIIGDSSSFQLILTYLIFPFVTITICVCMYVCMNHLLASLCKVLTGGR